MAWIILEGLDRSGKSSVAEYYKNQGFHYIHMSAPDKKYSEKGYTGPGYVDEMLELYTACDGRDVIFDRSIYGEKVWPAVYGRDPQLSYEEFELLQEFEERNGTDYILMWDQNFDAHWQRCADNNEPLSRGQFNHAVAMYERLENYGFIKKQLPEFKEVQDFLAKSTGEEGEKTSEAQTIQAAETTVDSVSAKNIKPASSRPSDTVQQLKLEEANAINSLLKGRIIKKRGPIFDDLERDIRDFLNQKLSTIFGNVDSNDFTEQEIQVLKLYAARILEKHKEL